MLRRDVVKALAAAAVSAPVIQPVRLHAQQPKAPVLGFLGSASPGPYASIVAAVRQGLEESGYVEGRNLVIEFRWAENQLDRLPALAAELVNRRVAVIATSGNVPPALAAKAATSIIPIVFHTGADPVAVGLVDSLNRPGGNVTGVTFVTAASISKRFGLLRDLLPSLKSFGLVVNPSDLTSAPVIAEMEAAARALRLALYVARAGSDAELEEAFATLARHKVDAVIVNTEPYFRTRAAQIVALAARYRLPDMYSGRDYVAAGGLMAYGASIIDAYRQQGVYVGKILKGEKPANLPVMQSAKFEFVINLATARRLGLAFSSGLMSIADEVIE
jgi:putative ABC transport system substrate-binding protein